MDHFFEQLDIVWTGESWFCSNQVKHYPACSKGSTYIPVHSFVWILDDGKKSFPAYVEDFFEDCRGQKMVKLRPFLSASEVEPLVPGLNPHSREVFITPSRLEISARHVKGPAEVLTPKHFLQHSSAESLLSYREFVNNRVRPFALNELSGYADQPAVSSREEEIMGIVYGLPAAGGPHDTVMWLKRGETVKRRLKKAKKVEVESESFPKVGETVEILCQDKGVKGCWFRCKVLSMLPKCLRVVHCDVSNVDGSGQLEDWVPKARVAYPDVLEMRCEGRLTVRPWPHWNSSDLAAEVGTAVDVWWYSGWWEAVVTRIDTSEQPKIQVYLPGEQKFLFFERKDVRASKDWIGEQWVDVKPKLDILSFLNSHLNPLPKVKLPQFTYSGGVGRFANGSKSELLSSSGSNRKKKQRHDRDTNDNSIIAG